MNTRRCRCVLAKFAWKECANGLRPGECVMLKSGVCLLAPGRRCGYFEESVLPIATRRLRLSRKVRPVDDTRVVTAYQRVHRETRGTLIAEADDDGIEKRLCPDCGAPLGSRMRFCEVCRTKHRRESARRQKARKRSTLSAVNAEKRGQNRLF